MKIVPIGDIHGRTIWKKIVEKERPDLTVFVGDYFDTFDNISAVEQMANFFDIVEYSKHHETVLLIGNHDHHYLKNVGPSGTSGYQTGAAPNITDAIEQHIDRLQMAYMHERFLFSHAGVSKVFMDKAFGDLWTLENMVGLLNGLFKTSPKSFTFGEYQPGNRYASPTGDDVWQSPIWIRPRSLMAANQDIKKEIVQIVGHTQMEGIDIDGRATGQRYFFIDTLKHREYLIINDNKYSHGIVYPD